jgi:hypothetical protein
MQDNIQSVYEDTSNLVATIVDYWLKWDEARNPWKEEKEELRKYLFATDTRKTQNSKLPWKNSTVTPKLTQIRDNLHANYIAALFPSEDWFTWESNDKTENIAKKRIAIVNYMKQKLKASNFQLLVSQLIYDYIDYGNVFVGHSFVSESKIDYDTKEPINLYTGPKAFRVNPLDVVINPLATSFESTPFIRRVLKSVGDLINDVETNPSLGYDKKVVEQIMQFRASYHDNPERYKNSGLIVDGFGSLDEYVNSDLVELIEFWGDIWDRDEGKYVRDVVVTIADRKLILRKEPNKSWLGKKPFFHCGWRLRPDNLWAQGPLDQLMGMQYRIDHLENLKADVFDQIAYPVAKVKGITVEEFEYAPGEIIFCGDEGDVEFMRPDGTALQADLQIVELMNRMEELAGAPKQAMGIRTPGEKTKYEVQVLENAAGRIFQSKVQWFEKNILEPLLNSMLEESRRNFGAVERIKTIDPDFGNEVFIEVTKDDLVGSGSLYPMGARHYAEQAKFIQELAQTVQTVGAIPSVAAHISGKAIAKALEENLGWSNYKIVKDNVMLFEQAETQRLMNQLQEDMAVEQQVPTEGVIVPEEGAM